MQCTSLWISEDVACSLATVQNFNTLQLDCNHTAFTGCLLQNMHVPRSPALQTPPQPRPVPKRPLSRGASKSPKRAFTASARAGPQPAAISPGFAAGKPAPSRLGSYADRAANRRAPTHHPPTQQGSPKGLVRSRLTSRGSPAKATRAFSPLSGRATERVDGNASNPSSHAEEAQKAALGSVNHGTAAANAAAGPNRGSGTSGIGAIQTQAGKSVGGGTPNATREKENLRHTLEAIAREAAQIQKELDVSAAPSLRARLNAAAALGRPMPADVTSSPSMTPGSAPLPPAANASLPAAHGMVPEPFASTPARDVLQVISEGMTCGPIAAFLLKVMLTCLFLLHPLMLMWSNS